MVALGPFPQLLVLCLCLCNYPCFFPYLFFHFSFPPLILDMQKRLIPPHIASWNKPLKVYQVCLSSFLVFGLLVVLYDLVSRCKPSLFFCVSYMCYWLTVGFIRYSVALLPVYFSQYIPISSNEAILSLKPSGLSAPIISISRFVNVILTSGLFTFLAYIDFNSSTCSVVIS